MKLPKRETRIKIRKATQITRNILAIAFGIMMLLGICVADSESIVYPLVLFIAAFACFGASYGLNHLLRETA